MEPILGPNEYGKSEIRLAYVSRDGDRHEFRDLSIDVALSGDFAAAHRRGDNTNILPTDTQKNTVYAFAKDHGIGEIEDFAGRLARHFVESHGPADRATVRIEEYTWTRLGPHSFAGQDERRHTRVTCWDEATDAISGLRGLRLINTTGSEFAGFAKDRYTTLPEARDRILATRVSARWKYAGSVGSGPGPATASVPAASAATSHTSTDQPTAGARGPIDWASSYAEARRHLLEAFVQTYSRSLQETLYAMGSRVLEHRPEIAAIRLSLPNIHHTPVDLSPFGLSNENEVFTVSDRPFGLIEGAVARDKTDSGDWSW
jgi:urate oxidase